ncbi:MAG: molybdopterin molybdotransferase MoeA [Bacteroidetes bacterium]|jgi:molybdopterin molybdotransferase|nr:molybdopterin molybdotransferase MoeA [Bacteroidota bacterium]
MISFEEAYKIVTSDIQPLSAEIVTLADSRGRVLSERIVSDMNMPPFDKAAVDGFACRRVDLGKALKVTAVIPAGSATAQAIEEGCCAKIMTGAMIPAGADCVVMVEETAIAADKTVIVKNLKTKNNIAYKAEDIQQGDSVIPAYTLIKPQHMAVMAAVGAVNPQVFRRVRLTVFSTGDELVEPKQKPKTGQIRNSNGIQLINQAAAMGCEARYGGIIPDDESASRKLISEALVWSDVLIMSGGISMGDFDYIPQILNDLGFQLHFQTIAVQPGKPTVFGSSGEKFVMALPGNPVSSLNIFELLAKPMLYRLMGYAFEPQRILLPLSQDYRRKRASRLAFVPARLTSESAVEPIGYHGSAHISALVEATALFEVPVGTDFIAKGEQVHVRFI